MNFISLTYTSLVRPDFQPADLQNLVDRGRASNEAAGITGLLIFNGTHFLHVFEGKHRAAEDLLKRLRDDLRHTGLEVRDERKIGHRSFPDWPLEMLLVDANYFQARDAIGDRLPSTVPEVIKMRLLRMTELISTMDFS